MTENGPRRIAMSVELTPHGYDPSANRGLFDGVLPPRVAAFTSDLVRILLPLALAAIFILFLGLATFFLGWGLFALLYPATLIWALLYCGLTLGSPASATTGMRAMDLEMGTWYGAPAYFLWGAVHAIVFWITISVLTPIVLGLGLLNECSARYPDRDGGDQQCAPRRGAPRTVAALMRRSGKPQSRLTPTFWQAILARRRTTQATVP